MFACLWFSTMSCHKAAVSFKAALFILDVPNSDSAVLFRCSTLALQSEGEEGVPGYSWLSLATNATTHFLLSYLQGVRSRRLQ